MIAFAGLVHWCGGTVAKRAEGSCSVTRSSDATSASAICRVRPIGNKMGHRSVVRGRRSYVHVTLTTATVPQPTSSIPITIGVHVENWYAANLNQDGG